ncbi:MAG TPA: hypothetical protein VLG92_02555 [Candidatus Saccharimonadia bacterium]|nr:hypothetical protein [Candidatus Saccharimonadia bacterium]
MSDDTRTPHERRKRNTPALLLTLLFLLAVATSTLFYHKYKQAQNTPENQQKQLVARVAKLVELPNATPAVVTIANKAKLTNKALAGHVENKDTLLIYDAAKRIIVYRPSIGKVVDMLSFGSQSTLPQQSSKP